MDESRSLKENFIRYIIPSILAQWVFSLYTMVDGMFVAIGVGETALTAVNLSYPFIACLFALSLMFAVGTSTVVAIFLGEGRKRKADEVFTQNIVIQLFLSAAITIGVMGNLEPLAKFLGAPDQETANYVVEYLSWIVPFSAAFLLSYSFEILLKTDGYPKKATMIVVLGALENCVLDWLFVIVLHKGIAGAAFATSISQATVIAFYLHHFLSRKGVLYFCRFRPDLSVLGRKLRNGFPSGVTELSSGMVTFIFNRAILMYLNKDALVSYTIVSYVNSLVVLSVTGIAQGSQPLISYYYGQKRMDKCGILLRYGITAAGIFCILSLAGGILLAPAIVNVYIGPDLPALRESSVRAFRIFILSFLLSGFNVVISGYFTSVECAGRALLISAGRGFVCIAGSLLLIPRLFGGEAIWWSPFVSEAVCMCVTLVLFKTYSRKASFKAALVPEPH